MIGYFDFHCHILPGIDDGAKNMDETYQMLSIAYEEGIRIIVATPHYIPGYKNASPEVLYALLDEVNQACADSRNDLLIILGNELMYSIDIIGALDKGEALTIEGTRYILMEFLQDSSFGEIREGLNHCIYAGYIPVLAHAERYISLVKKPELVEALIRLGAYIQINFSSITGGITDHKISFCHKLLKNEWVHFLGTDAHGSKNRAPYIKKAVDILNKKYGEAAVRRLLWDNPMTMLEDKRI